MLAKICREELSATLDTVAMEVLAEGGIEQPPVDAFALAAALGIIVAVDACQPGRARFVRLAGPRAGLAARDPADGGRRRVRTVGCVKSTHASLDV